MRRFAALVIAVIAACLLERSRMITPDAALAFFGASVQVFAAVATVVLIVLVAAARPAGASARAPVAFVPLGETNAWLTCPVCGGTGGGGAGASAGGGQWVRCAQCDTPHHADCARYVGQCSVYGCGNADSRSAVAATKPVSAGPH